MMMICNSPRMNAERMMQYMRKMLMMRDSVGLQHNYLYMSAEGSKSAV